MVLVYLLVYSSIIILLYTTSHSGFSKLRLFMLVNSKYLFIILIISNYYIKENKYSYYRNLLKNEIPYYNIIP